MIANYMKRKCCISKYVECRDAFKVENNIKNGYPHCYWLIYGPLFCCIYTPMVILNSFLHKDKF